MYISHLRLLIFHSKSDCLGCAVLLCLVVCLTLLASIFPLHLSCALYSIVLAAIEGLQGSPSRTQYLGSRCHCRYYCIVDNSIYKSLTVHFFNNNFKSVVYKGCDFQVVHISPPAPSPPSPRACLLMREFLQALVVLAHHLNSHNMYIIIIIIICIFYKLLLHTYVYTYV